MAGSIDGMRCSHTLDLDRWERNEDIACQLDVDDEGVVQTDEGQHLWHCPHGVVDGYEKCIFHLEPSERPTDTSPVAVFLDIVTGEHDRAAPSQFIDAVFPEFVLPVDVVDGVEETIDLRHARIGRLDWSDTDVHAHVDASGALIATDETAKFRLQNEPGADFSDLNIQSITFRATVFGDTTVFNGTEFFDAAVTFCEAEFDGETTFRRADFFGDATFRRATFSGNTTFHGTKFGAKASFHRGEFGDEAAFRWTEFGDQAVFKGVTIDGEASFWAAEFGDEAIFKGAEFGGNAGFERAAFDAEADFRETVFGAEVAFRGAEFGDEGRFTNAEFSDTVNSSGVTFDTGVDFEMATFENMVGFPQAQFGGSACFDFTVFESYSTFQEAEFDDGADFKGAQFADIANFQKTDIGGTANFEGVTFGGKADFREAAFGGEANFDWAQFDGWAGYRDAEFTGGASFLRASFDDFAEFGEAMFGGEAVFSASRFQEPANFSHAGILPFAPFCGAADFSRVQFEHSPTFNIFYSVNGDEERRTATFGPDVDFSNATFRNGWRGPGIGAVGDLDLSGAELEDSNFRDADLSDACLEDANLSRSALYGADLTNAELYGTLLSDARINDATDLGIKGRSSLIPFVSPKPEVIYDPRTDPAFESTDDAISNYTRAAGVYTALESLARKNADSKLASKAYAWRKDMQRKRYWSGEDEGSQPHRLAWGRSAVANAVVRYGESPYRVVGLGVLIVLTCGLLYYIGDLLVAVGETASSPPSLLDALYFSTLTFTTLGLGDYRPANELGRAVTIAETAAGVILLALLVFVFGRRATR